MEDKGEKKRIQAVAVLSVVYALFFTVRTAEHIFSWGALVHFFCALAVSLVVLWAVTLVIAVLRQKVRAGREEGGKSVSDRRFFLTAWGIYTLAVLPLWLALFPGIFGYDSYKQMEFYTGAEAWSTHHPVFHTWLLGTVLTAGKTVFGSYNAGVALYTFLQMLLTGSAFAYALLFLRQCRVPKLVTGIAGGFLLIHPTICLLSFNTTKDTLFGVCFLYFLIALLRLCDGENGKREIVLLFVSGLLSCLLRNQGVYVMAVLFVILGLTAFLRWRKVPEKSGGMQGRKALLVVLLLVCALTKLFDLACTGIFRLQKGEVREMLSVPMQQVAAVLIADREGTAVLDDTQRADAKTLIPDEALAVYEEDTADPVKGIFPSAQFQAYRGEYVKDYLSIVVQNPGICADAWFAMIRPYWDMSLARYRGLMAEYTGNCEEDYGIRENAVLPYVGHVLKVLAIYGDYERIPGVSALFNPGLYIWVAAGVLILSVVYGRKKALLACIPGLLYFCTLLLGPVALVRYLYPLLLTIPVLAGLLFENGREEKE